MLKADGSGDWSSQDLPRDLRLKVARGNLPMPGREMLHALIILLSDEDREVRNESIKTVKRLWGKLSPFISILNDSEINLLEDIFKNDHEVMSSIRVIGRDYPPGKVEKESYRAKPLSKEFFQEKENFTEIERHNIYKKILEMGIIQKIKLALIGNREVRWLLIRDPNKLVAVSVLKNPRLTDDEMVRIVQSHDVSDEVLRVIAKAREWFKNYQIKLGLVFNPKTPISISLRFLPHLHEKDLKRLARNKNVPITVSTTAKKILSHKNKA